MKEITTGNNIKIVYSERAVVFFSNDKEEPFASFEIPDKFQNIAAAFYDLIWERGTPTVLLGCRNSYDIAICLNESDGTMIDWHWIK